MFFSVEAYAITKFANTKTKHTKSFYQQIILIIVSSCTLFSITLYRYVASRYFFFSCVQIPEIQSNVQESKVKGSWNSKSQDI